MEITALSKPAWRNREPDQILPDLDALEAQLSERNRNFRESRFALSEVHVQPDGPELRLELGSHSVPFTHWSFTQLCRLLSAPPNYLRTLEPENAAKCLNDALEKNGSEMMFLSTGSEPTLRAIRHQHYGYLEDRFVSAYVRDLLERWPTFRFPKRHGGEPAGIHLSDRDLSFTLINEALPIEAKGETLHRALKVQTSEPGATPFSLFSFAYRSRCENGIFFGKSSETSFRLRHNANARERFRNTVPLLSSRLIERTQEGLGRAIPAAMAYKIPPEENVRLVWIRQYGFSEAEARRAITFAEAEEGGCSTLWDLVNGTTASARELPFISERTALERKAGVLLSLVEY